MKKNYLPSTLFRDIHSFWLKIQVPSIQFSTCVELVEISKITDWCEFPYTELTFVSVRFHCKNTIILLIRQILTFKKVAIHKYFTLFKPTFLLQNVRFWKQMFVFESTCSLSKVLVRFWKYSMRRKQNLCTVNKQKHSSLKYNIYEKTKMFKSIVLIVNTLRISAP